MRPIQPSFAGGEIAPSLYGRVDLVKYQTGLKTCRNFIVRQHGGVVNRPGTVFCGAAKDHSKPVRLIPFEFSADQTYVLAVSDYHLRVYKAGAAVVYPSGHARAGQAVEVTSPWPASDLRGLKVVQSADVLTVCHPAHRPRQIKRFDHHDWRIDDMGWENGPFDSINVDEGKVVTASAATGDVTLTANVDVFRGINAGDLIYLELRDFGAFKQWQSGVEVVVGEKILANGKVYECTALNNADGGSCRTGATRPSHDEGEQWDGMGNNPGEQGYKLGAKWRYLHGSHGIVKVTQFNSTLSVSARVIKRLPDSVVSPGTYKWALSAWGARLGYPSTAAYFQQRMVFGGTREQPQTVWMSQIGNFKDFGTSTPGKDDDAITFNLVSSQVNAVRHIIALSSLILLTSSAEWSVGKPDDAMVASNLALRIHGYRGTSHIAPLVIGSMALTVQDKGSIVRDLGYKFESDSYSGDDLTVMAPHLFYGRQIVEWAFAQVPMSVVWAVRDDGILAALTYLREHDVWGWHWHDTDGAFESVCSVSEGAEDAVYVVVCRTIAGQTRRYIERFSTRTIRSAADGIFMDSALSYDGREPVGTVTLSSTAGWSHLDAVTAELAGAASLSAADVGAEILVPYDDKTLRLRIESIASAAAAVVRPNRDVPEALRGTPIADWSLGRRRFSGLDHLEGKTVAVLADGSVQPNAIVVEGAIEIPQAAAVVHVGLPYASELETLSVTTQDKDGTVTLAHNKLISRVTMLCEDSRGVWAGPDPEHLVEVKQRAGEHYDQAVRARTGFFDLRIPARWESNGRVFVRQADPLPLSVLAILPDVATGGA